MTHPFEIHLTVRTPAAPDSILTFTQACEVVGVKPLVVELGMVGQDVMTSSQFEGTFTQALLDSAKLSEYFRARGMEVVRVKIETVPTHPAANAPTPLQYFESHLAVQLPLLEDDLDLRNLAAKSGCHTSRNAFKVYPDYRVIMVTKRDTDCLAPEFIQRVDTIRKILTDSDFKVGKPIVEFVIYDSNQAHDDRWIAEANHIQH